VPRVTHRLGSVAVAVALSANAWAACAGWQPTAGARRACCASGTCPGHEATPASGNGDRAQAAADSCCAGSERSDSRESGPAFASSFTIAVLGPAVWAPPRLARAERQSSQAPIPPPAVPRHALLSVFLI
jgi:hypothetical protein